MAGKTEKKAEKLHIFKDFWTLFIYYLHFPGSTDWD